MIGAMHVSGKRWYSTIVHQEIVCYIKILVHLRMTFVRSAEVLRADDVQYHGYWL